MVDRLRAVDASFLYAENATTPMHVGEVLIMSAPRGGLGYEQFLALVNDRLALVPRYRQRIMQVPGRIANPVWVDDTEFDISYHVRRSALPAPGSNEQLAELASRLMSRRLDRDRPLWEAYFVENLKGGRIGLIAKAHNTLVDGIAALGISDILLDNAKISPIPSALQWRPRPTPSPVQLMVDAVKDYAQHPRTAVETIRTGAADARATMSQIAETVGGAVAAARSVARPPEPSPLNVPIGSARRYAIVQTDLAPYRAIRERQGCSINDVALAVVAGALRTWLLARGQTVRNSTMLRAMLPTTVRRTTQSGQRSQSISALFVDLPIGEPHALIRLSQITFANSAHRTSGQAVGAQALINLAGIAPPTLHSLAARAATKRTDRMYNLVITNVPGPQRPLYIAGCRVREMYPVVPLTGNQALAVGLTSYNGKVFYGLNADRDAMGDVHELGVMIEESLSELTDLCQ